MFEVLGLLTGSAQIKLFTRSECNEEVAPLMKDAVWANNIASIQIA